MPRKTGKAAHREVANQTAIEERRVKVAVAILNGLTYREIAAQLNVSTGTVTADRRAILTEWRKHYTDKADQYVAIQLRRLDVLLNAIWQQAVGNDDTAPSLPHVDRIIRIIERQERLLGIGAGSPAQNPAAQVNVNIHIDDFTDDIQAVKDYEREQFRNALIPPEPPQN